MFPSGLSTIFSYLKKQNSNYFFSFPRACFLSTHLCLHATCKKGAKNSLSYGCSKIQRCIISDVRLQAALEQQGGRGAIVFFNVREQNTDSELLTNLWFSIPSWLLHKGLKEKGKRQEVLLMPFQQLSSFSRGRERILSSILFTVTSGIPTTESKSSSAGHTRKITFLLDSVRPTSM